MMRRKPGASTRRLRRGAATIARATVLGAALAAVSCTPAPREPGTVVMASGTDLESGNPLVTVHPLSRQIQRHALFVTLVRLDAQLHPEPYYARRWEWSADRRAVIMTLDSSLRWHDGAPTTARDVVFTLRMARDSALGSPRRGDVLAIDSAIALDAHHVRVLFATARAELPPVLAELPLVPEHLLASVPAAQWRAHAFATAPVGNGPFRFAGRIPGRQWRFERHPGFPVALGGPPTLKALVVAVVDEAATKFAGLVSGELDLAGISPTMARLVEQDAALTLETPPALFSTILAFNTTRPPLDDGRVRQAIAASLDRQRIVRAAVAGYGTPAMSALPPGLPVSPPPVTETAQARALAVRRADSLLEAAGWQRTGAGPRQRDGRPLRLTLLTVGSGDMAVEQLVQADLAARGIALDLRVLELATFLSTVRAPEKTFDLALTGIPGDIALGHLSAMFSATQAGGALDYTGYHEGALSGALARAREATPASAGAAWAEVDRVLLGAAPVAWVYHARGVQGRTRALTGVTMDLRGELTSVARWARP